MNYSIARHDSELSHACSVMRHSTPAEPAFDELEFYQRVKYDAVHTIMRRKSLRRIIV